jgi:membrane protein implicated in regulation of membrane protease activity
MDSWIAWLLVGCVLAVGEMLTTGFFLAPFAAGAFAAAVLALVGAGAVVSTVVFAVMTALLFGLVRPIARRHLRTPPEIRTGTAALIGRPAVVLERIANHEGVGSVKIEGEVWSARSWDDDHVIEAGERVEVIEIRGATALVSD